MKKNIFIVAIVVFSLPLSVFAKLPNDPQVSQWGFADTHVYEAWDFATGSSDVIVAVVDNGFDSFHPDLAENVWKNIKEIPDNSIDDDRNGYVDDVWGWNFELKDTNNNGTIDPDETIGTNDPRPAITTLSQQEIEEGVIHHGTLVAGIIGSVGNNGQYGAGINWRVKLMNVKVLGNSGGGQITQLGQAIRYAVDNGASIINISLVGDSGNREINEAVQYAYEKGVVVVAAAGNGGTFLDSFPYSPVCADAGEKEQRILGVSAIDEIHRIARFSNIGSSCVDITAPGVNIASSLRYAPREQLLEAYGGGWKGTSFATPFVSGAAALIKSIHPEWKAKEIYAAILSTTHKTPTDNEAEYAHLYGAGLLQIDKAVQFALKTPSIPRARVVTAIQSMTTTGRLHEWKQGKGIELPRPITLSRSVYDIASFETSDRSGFVTIQEKNTRFNTVTIYDAAWNQVQSWEVPMGGKQSVHVVDILGDSTQEILFAPQAAAFDVARIYTFDGKEVEKIRNPQKHEGVSLGFVTQPGFTRPSLLATFLNGGFVTMHEYDYVFAIKKTIQIPDLDRRGVVTSADIDGDGQSEYVIGGGVGELPYLFYYSADRKLLRQFTAFDPAWKGGMRLLGADINKDGTADVIVAPPRGAKDVVVFDGRARMIEEWLPFGQKNVESFVLFPQTKE